MSQRNDSHSRSRGSRLILLVVTLGLLMAIAAPASAATKSLDPGTVTEFKSTDCFYGQLRPTVRIVGPAGWNAAVRYAEYRWNGQAFPYVFTTSWEGFTLGSGYTDLKRPINAINGHYMLKAQTAILNPYTGSWVYGDWVEPAQYNYPGWTNFNWCKLG